MTVEHLSDDLLSQHFDGELEPAEASAAQAHLAGCSSCSARYAALQRLQRLVQVATQDAAEAAGERAPWADMFARIERAAAEGEASSAPATNVIQLEAGARAAHAAAATSAAKGGKRAKRIGPATMSAFGALAVAAAVLLMLFRADPEPTEASLDEADQLASLTRSEVVEIDFGNNAGTVFEIALSDGSSTPVVWINDDDEEVQ